MSISGCLTFGDKQNKSPTLLKLAFQWDPQAINEYQVDT